MHERVKGNHGVKDAESREGVVLFSPSVNGVRFEHVLRQLIAEADLSPNETRVVQYFTLRAASEMVKSIKAGEVVDLKLGQVLPLPHENTILKRVRRNDGITEHQRLNVDEFHYKLESQPDLPIGKVVEIWRKHRGIKGIQLSKEAGLDSTYDFMLEHGRLNPSLDALRAVAGVLGVDVEDLSAGRIPVLKVNDHS